MPCPEEIAHDLAIKLVSAQDPKEAAAEYFKLYFELLDILEQMFEWDD